MGNTDLDFARIAERINKSNGGPRLVRAARAMGRLAKSGHAPAQNNFGALLQYGRGVAENLELARFHYQKAAMQELPKAEFNLGYMWLHGIGGDKDAGQAFQWFCRAASRGDVDALTHLGRMYLLGEGTEADPTKGIQAWAKGARSGDARCAYNLGSAHAGGQVGAADLVGGLGWFLVAHDLGNPAAEAAIHKILPVIAPEEIRAADAFLTVWQSGEGPIYDAGSAA